MNVSGRKQPNANNRFKGGGYRNSDRLQGNAANTGNKTAATDLTSYNVYNASYGGKTYSVKYLGIVDGTMGILSRKMALTTADQAAMAISPGMPNDLQAISPEMHQIISEDNFTNVSVKKSIAEPTSPKELPSAMAPVLGKKNYTETVGRNRRTQIIDENTQMVQEIHDYHSNLRAINPYISTNQPPLL